MSFWMLCDTASLVLNSRFQSGFFYGEKSSFHTSHDMIIAFKINTVYITYLQIWYGNFPNVWWVQYLLASLHFRWHASGAITCHGKIWKGFEVAFGQKRYKGASSCLGHSFWGLLALARESLGIKQHGRMGWINCEPWGSPFGRWHVHRTPQVGWVQTPMECVQWVGPNAEGKPQHVEEQEMEEQKTHCPVQRRLYLVRLINLWCDGWACIKHLGPTKSDRTLHDYDLHGSSFSFKPACHVRKDKETCCRCLLYLSLSLFQLLFFKLDFLWPFPS